MHISVAICTWNRAALLDQTLLQLHDLAIPAGVQWELVVVNNHCTDTTDEVLSRHGDRLPLRRVFEPIQGLSHARNAAVRAACGELLLWTDDDVLVDRNWLAEYVLAAQTWPDVSFFGGTIVPWFETPPPAWITAAWPRVCHAYATRELGNDAFDIDANCLPYGANYAVRTDVQRRYEYDSRLGRTGSQMLAGEETACLMQLLAAGHRGRFVPTARVRHFIPQERLTLDFVRRWFFGLGQTHALWFQRNPSVVKRLIHGLVRMWFRGNALYAEAAYGLTWRRSKTALWVRYATHASYCRGWLSP